MNKIVTLPSKIKVEVTKDKKGLFIADLKDLNTHVEADNEFDLIKLVNNSIKLYFDLPESSKIFYAPAGMFERSFVTERKLSPTFTDFLKYLPSKNNGCYC